MNDLRGERLQIMLSPEELSVIDDFDFSIVCRPEPRLFASCLNWASRRLRPLAMA